MCVCVCVQDIIEKPEFSDSQEMSTTTTTTCRSMCVCVCVCVCARARARVCVCVCVRDFLSGAGSGPPPLLDKEIGAAGKQVLFLETQ